jgi:cell wall-associated NlpC family hydrolase
MDCSGLVVRLYQDIYGTRLPHKTRDLYVRSSPVPPRVAEVGDLVFFRIGTGAQPAHVGVYMGRGEFIHASSSRGVILSRLDETYYRQRFMCFRRIGPG